jgi:hypothetical protein
MKTATITFATVDTPLPNQSATHTPPGFVGFQLTVTKPDGTVGAPAVDPKLVWVIGNFIPGGTYSLKVDMVDGLGGVIDSFPPQTFIVPGADIAPILTYPKVSGVDISWGP